MLIKDLIAKLKEYPQDMMVLVQHADEDSFGYDEINFITHKIVSFYNPIPLIDDPKYVAKEYGMQVLIFKGE